MVMVLCDQIGVNLVACQRLRLMWLRREGLGAWHVLRAQIGGFLVTATVLPSLITVVSTFVMSADSRLGWDVAMMSWVGQCAWYAAMAASAVLLSARCQPVDSGLYAIGLRPALLFAVICAVSEAMLLLLPAALAAMLAVGLCALSIACMRDAIHGLMVAG